MTDRQIEVWIAFKGVMAEFLGRIQKPYLETYVYVRKMVKSPQSFSAIKWCMAPWTGI